MILAIDPVEMKLCPRCRKSKPIQEFPEKKFVNGRTKWCNSCKRKYETEYREKNAEKIRASRELRKDAYYKNRKTKYQANKDEMREKTKNCYRKNIKGMLLCSAKRRAREFGIPCTITKDDIIVPDFCPVLGIKLSVGDGNSHDASPSLDRIYPALGYIQGNVMVISHKANTIKNNATVEELEKVYMFYKNYLKGGD